MLDIMVSSIVLLVVFVFYILTTDKESPTKHYILMGLFGFFAYAFLLAAAILRAIGVN